MFNLSHHQTKITNFNQDGRTSGKLCQLIQETVELSLMPPERDAEEMVA